ncbi:DNA-binding NarL/FixJ family response regulator [Streptosporangium becharense]|uniref:DNA-binding NarL/FixJ family response regulator n=1 Tax=Streptosporangium becharense TaxID=1816182 RepID=A0A7W9MGQ0_9ACTN|nr:response regulator transcription factor [Streptosporangium becharense]MBB2914827.1 DNA-binding NarL/FixJ family response regulator [Streptosporangium becharense]MBB5820362.1 DNA-binding NarL/FixJ family response regulator [Streptosporangium becharense]
MTIRVLVADDHAAVRAGIVLILDGHHDIEVVGQAADGDQAVALALELRPDVVLMDIRMPKLDGLSATRRLSGVADVLILTTFDIDEYVFGALRAGAAGFLLKNTEADALADAVRVVARGDGLIAPAVTRRLISAFGAAVPERRPREVEGLTQREREVLACIGRGMSNAEISAELNMAEATTKTHVSRLLSKLGLRSRVQAAILAQELSGGCDRRTGE